MEQNKVELLEYAAPNQDWTENLLLLDHVVTNFITYHVWISVW